MNPIVPVIAITLDRERKLCYPAMVVFAVLPDVFGYKHLADIPADCWNPRNARDRCAWLTKLLWAGLFTEDRSLTLEQVEAMVYPRNFNYIEEKTTEAFAAAMPEPKPEDKAGEADEPADPTPAA